MATTSVAAAARVKKVAETSATTAAGVKETATIA